MNASKIDLKSLLAWAVVALLGASAVGVIALQRGETINSFWFVVAAVCVYSLSYRFYSAFIAAKVLVLDASRATPAERFEDGRDFVPTNKWVVFGHHFAAIAGPGPLIGPTLAAQFGYLPGTLWILIGAVQALKNIENSIVIFHIETTAVVFDSNNDNIAIDMAAELNCRVYNAAREFNRVIDQVPQYLH